MAREGEFAAAAQGEAVHRRDHRAAEALESVEHTLTAQSQGAGLDRRGFGQLRDVGAGHERLLPRAGDDQSADRSIGFEFGQGRVQFADNDRVQRVQLVGPIDW